MRTNHKVMIATSTKDKYKHQHTVSRVIPHFEETPPKLRPTSSTTSPSHSMEAEVDKLVVQYKRENLEQEPTAKRLKVQKRSFAPRKTNEEIEKAKLGAIPQKTLQVGVACMHALVW